jgi:ribonuclease R
MSDPHYDREAEKYESPIPSREHILSFIQEKPRSKRQLFELLALADEQKKAFERRLRAMVRDKQLSCNKSGVYRLFSNRGLLTGTVIANPKDHDLKIAYQTQLLLQLSCLSLTIARKRLSKAFFCSSAKASSSKS